MPSRSLTAALTTTLPCWQPSLPRALADAGYLVLRYDLPFRQRSPKGPPSRGRRTRSAKGVAAAIAALGRLSPRRSSPAGQSYGGRQTTMAAAEI